jgi:hypothetical protein
MQPYLAKTTFWMFLATDATNICDLCNLVETWYVYLVGAHLDEKIVQWMGLTLSVVRM